MLPASDTTPDNPWDARVAEIRRQGLFAQRPEPYVPVSEPDETPSLMAGMLFGVIIGHHH
jgi:hypothetical protein